MALRDILDQQAGTIEYVLHTHGINARVDGGKLSPRLAHFHLLLPDGFNPSRLVPLVPELAQSLGVTACRLSQHEGSVYLECPRPDPVPVRLLPLVQRVADVVPPATASLGLDSEGTPLLLRLNSPEVDPVMLAGGPMSGKSSLLRGMALSLALHNSPERLRLLLLDCAGDGSAFRGLERLPHLACPVANGPVEALVSLRWASRALARRTNNEEENELFFDDDMGDQAYDPAQSGEPELVIIVDGVSELLRTAGGRPNSEAVDSLRRLLLAGSSRGIHVVLAAEQPDDLMSINTSWGARITGRVASPDEARVATGVKGSGAHGLLGAGDFLVSLNAELIRFQAAAVSEQELARAVDLIVACANTREREQEQERLIAPQDATSARLNRGQQGKPGAHPLPIRREWAGDLG
jgi:S-DNA-T family DNA segregation ATPase FtsK/SpoIIIE